MRWSDVSEERLNELEELVITNNQSYEKHKGFIINYSSDYEVLGCLFEGYDFGVNYSGDGKSCDSIITITDIEFDSLKKYVNHPKNLMGKFVEVYESHLEEDYVEAFVLKFD